MTPDKPTTPAPPLPPDLLAKAAEAIVADRQKYGYHTTHQEARVDAEVALRAVDVPGLLAEIERLKYLNGEFARSVTNLDSIAKSNEREMLRGWNQIDELKEQLATALAQRDEAQRAAALHRDEADNLREHLNALILENGLTASQLRARIQLLVQRPDGTPSARVRALIDANHALTQQRDEAREALAALYEVVIWMSGSNDFSEEGQAHEGWLKAQPAIEQARRVLGKEAKRES